jgi:SAM-dependent methyltransferase
MNAAELMEGWKGEEAIAQIHGWDFSHIEGRYWENTDLPWDYRCVIEQYRTSDMKILDIDTGGGEFLLSLGHPCSLISATEGYAPNFELCQKRLIPLGIDLKEADAARALPFADESFDLVLNRHGDLNASEIYRVLKKGGFFVTQQVGAENDRELVELLLGKEAKIPFPNQYLQIVQENFESAGFEILQAQEAFRELRFFDVGALVWFAKIIAWEFPHFSVQTHTQQLWEAQERLTAEGFVRGRTHRFLLVAKK